MPYLLEAKKESENGIPEFFKSYEKTIIFVPFFDDIEDEHGSSLTFRERSPL